MNTKEETQRQERVRIVQLPTGVQGLDEILGGGLPQFSFNIIAGAPGCGKTSLAHQIMFANATPECPAVYFTVLGEPAIKMLRYQQQFTFFDQAKLDGSVRFVNLSQLVLEQNLDAVLKTIVEEVEAWSAKIVVVDSFRTVIRRAQGDNGTETELQAFVQRLAIHLTSLQATTFLIGEYVDLDIREDPVFTVADGLIWLFQSVDRNSIVRKMQIMKLRGQASIPGMHTFRITDHGLQTFPRTYGLSIEGNVVRGPGRLSTGVLEVDAMLGGGIPEGDSMLLAGPSGSGKSVLASQFIAAGLSKGEPGVIAIFEELPAEYARRAASLGMDFHKPQEDGILKIIYIRPLDLSVDETVHEITTAVKMTGAKRVVLDSLVGFEMALAPDFRQEFRESLYRMIVSLTRLGITVISTVEVEENFISMGLSHYAISFLSDDILRLRYVSINGQLRKMMLAVKMRGSQHSTNMWEYTISSKGIVLGERFRGYRGLTTGIPSPWSDESGQNDPDPHPDLVPHVSRNEKAI